MSFDLRRLPPWTLAAPLLLAACSGDGDPSPSPTAPPSTDTPTLTAAPTPTASNPTPTASNPTPTATAAGTPTATQAPTPTATAAPTPTATAAPILPTYALSGEVEVLFDASGIPHIYGPTLEDVLFMQGYLGARDRLWQMDMFRRVAHGRSAEVLGEGALEGDLFTRYLGLSHYAQLNAEKMPTEDPEAWGWLEAYSAGINAFREDALEGRRGAELSPQFDAMGYIPEPWLPVDTLALDKLQTYSLSSDHTTELQLGLAVDYLLSDNIYLDVFRPAPLNDVAILPDYYEGLDLGEDARRARQATPPTREARLEARRKARSALPSATRAQVLEAMKILESVRLPWEGSNNWVISGAHTASGNPIVASDTHEGVGAPATYWQVHLESADGRIHSAGHSFAGIPFVAFGHNDAAAWAPTTNFVDVTDVFRETYNRVTGTVLHDGRPREIETRPEVFLIRKAGAPFGDNDVDSREVKIVPHHGPMLPEELLAGIPLSVSAAWTGSVDRHSLRFLYQVNTAHTFEDLQAAQDIFVAGAVNMVFADNQGNIGYNARVDVPIRQQVTYENPPYLMLPGEGGYDWTEEIYPNSWLPHVKNPENGFVVTANNDAGGQTFDNNPVNEAVYLAGAYDSGTRAKRITDLIEGAISDGGRITMEDVARWQTDGYSEVAAATLPYLLMAADNNAESLSAPMAAAIAELRAWDYDCGIDVVAPTIFHAWLPSAFKANFGDDVGDELFDDLSGVFVHVFVRPFAYYLEMTAENIEAIEAGEAPFPSETGTNYFDDIDTEGVVETRDQILLAALAEALDNLNAAYGPMDPEAWRWGNAHQITFNDDAEGALPSASSGSYEINGGLFTVDVADFRFTRGGALEAPFDVGNAPSNRTIIEVGPSGFETMDVLPGGQSERPGDPHFLDQASLYTQDEYRALPYARGEVEAAEESRATYPEGFPAVEDMP